MTEINVGKDTSGNIIITFPYSSSCIAKIKTISGYKWHPLERHWGFPDTDHRNFLNFTGKSSSDINDNDVKDYHSRKGFGTCLQQGRYQKRCFSTYTKAQFRDSLVGKRHGLRYIQELLGHKDSKTTEVYTHVSTKSLGKIKSPLDSLNIKEESSS